MGLLCDVQLDNASGIYHPGQVVSGRLVVTLTERALMKALALKIAGYAATRWEKPLKENKKEQNTPQQPELYTQREDYLYTLNYYMGSEDAYPNIIEKGCYSYNFSVRLPDHCPSNYESTLGRIRYELEVFIDYPDHRHICFTRLLYVQRAFDLRQVPGLAQSFDMVFMEKKSYVKFWQKPLQMVLNVPQTGYVPGEPISVHVKILNYGRLVLTDLVYKLNLIGTYTGSHKKKTKVKIERTNLVKSVHTIFGENGTIVQHLQMLHVPETPSNTNVGNCKCIQIGYEVEVTVNTTKQKRWLQGQLPICIGTIPLNGFGETKSHTGEPAPILNTPQNLLVMRSMEDLSLPTEFSATAPSPSAELPLSVSMSSLAFKDADYMQAQNLNKNSKRSLTGDQIEFKPKYLYYEIENILHEAQAAVAETNHESHTKEKC